MKYYHFLLITLVVIILDQTTKLGVYFTMERGEEFAVLGDWFKIHYTLNPGMAFGLTLDSKYGKLILSSFRIVATIGIATYLYYLVSKKAHRGFAFSIALILAGALGNVLDSIFYGVFLEDNLLNAYGEPLIVPTPWLHGQVIDMIYVDIWAGNLPEWLPFIGGDYYAFWPIFNIADSSIFVGVSIILIWQKTFFSYDDTSEEKPKKQLSPDA